MKYFLYILILVSAIEISGFRVIGIPHVVLENTKFLKENCNPFSRFILKQSEPDPNILSSGKVINSNPGLTFHYYYEILAFIDPAQIIIHLSEFTDYHFTRAP
jgi:hypothetical protein